MEGFKRDPSKEVERKPRKRVFGKVKKKEIDRAVPPPMREQIARAIMALGFREVYAHDIQGEITRWIRNHFGSVNPETVQRRWREMIREGDVVVEKKNVDGMTMYSILRVGDVEFDPRQTKLF